MTKTSRRLQVLRIDEWDLINAITSSWNPPPAFVNVIRCPAMPPDARLLRVGHDPIRRSFLAMLEHPSFAEVPDGEEIPFFPTMGQVFIETVRVAPAEPAPDVTVEGL